MIKIIVSYNTKSFESLAFKENVKWKLSIKYQTQSGIEIIMKITQYKIVLVNN